MPKTKIINLKNSSNAGDNSNSQAISNELNKLTALEVVTVDVSEFNLFLENFEKDSKDKYVVIGAGEHSIAHLVKAKQVIGKVTDITTVWAGHQFYPQLVDVEKYLDKIAMPGHIDFSTKDSKKLIKTLGVAGTLTREEVIKSYENNKQDIIPSNNGYIMVMMGGDADDPTKRGNKIRHYTVAEADKLASFVSELSKRTGKKLLITNGPRTGKFDTEKLDEKGQSVATLNHRDFDPATKQTVNTPLDPCSVALLQTLNSKGLEEGKDFQFSDFRFLEKGVNSAYQKFLGAVIQNPSSFVLMAGESTSMLTDCIKVLPNTNALASYNNEAMNSGHLDYVALLNNNGYIQALNTDFGLIKKDKRFKLKGNVPSSVEIHVATEISKQLNKHNLKPSFKTILKKIRKV